MNEPSVQIKDASIDEMKRQGWQFQGVFTTNQKVLAIAKDKLLEKGAHQVAFTYEVDETVMCWAKF